MEFHPTPANFTGLAGYNVLLFQQGSENVLSPNPWKYRDENKILLKKCRVE